MDSSPFRSVVRRARRIGALVTVAVVVAAPARAQQRRALLIGIDHYDYGASMPPGWRAQVAPAVAAWRAQVGGRSATGADAADALRRTTVGNLDGSVNDATAMAAVLRARFQFASPEVLTNAQATRANILAALHRLAAESHPGDVVVFYYAGHGSQRVNSRSRRKANHLDQTIVPADANAGQFDIRDVELAAAFGTVLDAIGATGRLTLIFDSCHSGMLSRGETSPTKLRWAAADPRDAADAADVRPLEERGALFIAAAQDFETAAEEPNSTVDGKPHGAFTNALLRVLKFVPPNEPATQVFARVRAILQQDGRQQHPTIRGIEDDPRRPMFGAVTGALAGRTVAPVLRVRGDTVRLQAGVAAGLARGTELRLADTVGVASGRTTTVAPVRLRVTGVYGLGESDAVVVAGAARQVAPGQLFVVDRWSMGDAAALRVWIPPARDAGTLVRDAAALLALGGLLGTPSPGAPEFVADPTTIPDDGRPLYVVRYEAAGWRLVTPGGTTVALAAVDAAAVRQAIAQAEQGAVRERGAQAQSLRAAGADPTGVVAVAAARPRVTVLLPPPPALRTALRMGRGTENSAIEVVTEPREADYLLVGSLGEAGARYGWLRPNATARSQRTSPLPARSYWVGATGQEAADSLTDLATRLARLRGWLTLAAPPDTGSTGFPYRLALRNVKTHALRDSGETHDGEQYDLVLRRDTVIPMDHIPTRWVFVLAIDSYGCGQPLFPQSGLGGNRVPIDSAGAQVAPAEIPLKRSNPIKITPPYGVDTFLLLTTSDAIDPEVLRLECARGQDRGAAEAPRGLGALLAHVGRTRGIGDDAIPVQWSIQQLPLLSGPAGAGQAP